MKYELSEKFQSDYRRLDEGRKALFKSALVEFKEGAAAAAAGSPDWHPRLRVKRVQGSDGIWEMTWNFARPDGRATFQWTTVDDEPAIRWRRIGDHDIFGSP